MTKKKTLSLPKKGGPRNTPVAFHNTVPPAKMHSMIEEWSLTNAENAHVETLEEANDFNIGDDDDDFFEKHTVYEMHDQAEENLQLFQQNTPAENKQETQTESNETVVSGENQPSHDQSAPNQPNSSANPSLVQPSVDSNVQQTTS